MVSVSRYYSLRFHIPVIGASQSTYTNGKASDVHPFPLEAEGDGGVDASSAAGGEVTGEEGDGEKENSDDHEGGWIGGADMEEHVLHEAR